MADLNIRGGVIGQKVALVTHDDGCAAAPARVGAQALKGSEVAGAIGGVCASAASAEAPMMPRPIIPTVREGWAALTGSSG